MDLDVIQCIFYSEFHPTTGPMIYYQIPDNFISKEDFDLMNLHIITKRQLHNIIVANNFMENKVVVGCPIHITLDYMARNVLIFNLSFVFDASVKTARYEMIVKKLAYYLTSLELECHFISNEEFKRTRLPDLMKRLLHDLNTHGEFHEAVTNSTTMHLEVPRQLKSRPTVRDHDVPVLIDPPSLDFSHLELGTKVLLPLIDGFNHVGKIAHLANADVEVTRQCVADLIQRGTVKIVPIFQYTDVYVSTPHVQELLHDRDLQSRCQKEVALPGMTPSVRDLYELYCALVAGTTVREVANRMRPRSLGMDERKLVQFGALEGMIRRLHKYPIYIRPSTTTNLHSAQYHKPLYKYFDGNHSYDEICCHTGMSYKELEERVIADSNIVVCWK